MRRGTFRSRRWLFLVVSNLAFASSCRVEGDGGSGVAESVVAPAPAPLRSATARYLANAGVLVVNGETKVAFDPLFRNDFGAYELLPEDMERALFAGEAPFDGLDAVFISHYHEDHFSREDLLRLLEARPALRLYAPEQAVAEMRDVASSQQSAVFERVVAIALEYRDAPATFEEGELVVEAVRIPHSGWPERQRHVENLAYRVTLASETTVVHLGDADTSDAHFAHDAEHWKRRATDVAFPPYWYFLSDEGRKVLDHRIAPAQAIGVHVPVEVPAAREDREPELRAFDLFTEPGETREIP